MGTPLFKDDNLPEGEQRIDLTKRVHNQVCLLADVDPKENIYEPIFNNSRKIEK